MKRFYDDVGVMEQGAAFGIALDGKPVRTPARQILTLPNRALADEIAAEWRAQGDEIHPRDMVLTQLANSAIDRTRPNRTLVIEQIAAYGETDLLCYRASEPPDLAAQQADSWQPILDWLNSEYSASLAVTSDIAPVEQAEEALVAIFAAVARHDDFRLTGLHSATTATGSVALGLALAEGRITAEEGWALSQLDALYQAGKWGEDPEAAAARRNLREIMEAAARFMSLAGEA